MVCILKFAVYVLMSSSNRKEVWLYLLGVLSADKSKYDNITLGQEMTAVRSKFLEYESVSKRIPLLEKQIRTEVLWYFRQRMSSHSLKIRRDVTSGWFGSLIFSIPQLA